MLNRFKPHLQSVLSSSSVTTLLTLLLLLTIQACVPQSSGNSARKSSKTNSATTGTSKTPAPGPSFVSTDALYWFSGSKITGTITINQNMETVIYLRGSTVHNFLASSDTSGVSFFSKTYCMVFNYSHSTAKKQLRVRAIPITFNDFSTHTTERLLRLDFPSQLDNLATCSGNVGGISASSDIAYYPGDFCSSCFELITSGSLGLYTSNGSSISTSTLVPLTSFNVTGLGLRIDTTSGSTTETSVCSNASCGAKGFDCCLNGQCVKDGSEKTTARTDPSYSQAQLDIASNPLNFINWPNLYYICTNIPHVQPSPTAYPNASATAQAAFDILVREYYCLEEGKKTTPNYANGTCSKSTYTTKASCEAGSGSGSGGGTWTYYCFPNGLRSDYDAIQSSVWERCGCEASPFPTAPTDPKCPDFGLKATFDLQNKITSVTCLIPVPDSIPTPFQKLQVNVPARSAPHRFYRADGSGLPVDDLGTLKNISPTPVNEGTAFSYIDETGKSGALNADKFNMNAILGQITVDLTKAKPAVVINVEYDQTYIISALRGSYNPCPMCAKDSWFDAFTPFPASTQGRGLEAIGHTTSRDSYQTNITLGNYEDTIFGRACFIPPTMIPFSHMKRTTVIQQRQTRLSTQAALFVNGYQRDWYGFNKGALIGSFDGVAWFAIGGGRRIQAKSNRLFLAINSPFADLAQNTDIVANIILDNGNNVASDFDYDPNLTSIDSQQNTGASCQKYHQCETDGDCVTQLGWEYMCMNISAVKTYVPKYDLNGNEQIDEKSGGIVNVLGGKNLPTGSKKRCVYRGMGSPCKVNFMTGTLYDPDTTTKIIGNAKIFACAPNFYCAKLTETNVFNDQVIREPSDINNILYGKDADILGRPKSYTTGGKSLPSDVKDNLAHNFALYTSNSAVPVNTSEWGLCMPGKTLAKTTWNEQQWDKDNSRRTDFISQIGSCNSDQIGNSRLLSCPSFDMREFFSGTKKNANYKNYIITASGLGEDSSGSAYFTAKNPNDQDYMFRKNQNICGKEAIRSSGSGYSGNLNAWKDIEYGAVPASVLLPGLAQNACLRRAGSICHTDLDCAPNIFHATQAKNLDKTYFGNSGPEQMFWQENLICGQKDTLPFLNSANFSTYDLKQNRCCRAIGNSISLFSSASSTSVLDDKFQTFFSNSADASAFRSYKASLSGPQDGGRYSRYSSVPFGSVDEHGIKFESPHIDVASSATLQNLNFQWKTINETAKLTCCGTGAIRKFADGTHDWTIRDRLKIQPEKFKCLNYQTELAYDEDAAAIMTNITEWRQDNSKYCIFPDAPNKGCFQKEIPDSVGGFEITVPSTIVWPTSPGDTKGDPVLTGYETLEMYPEINPFGSGADTSGMRADLPERLDQFVPFVPQPFWYPKINPSPWAGSDPSIFKLDWYNGFDMGYDQISFYIPSYMGNALRNIRTSSMVITYKGPDGETGSAAGAEWTTPACSDSAVVSTVISGATGDNRWCHFDSDGRHILAFDIIGEDDVPGADGSGLGHMAGIKLKFAVPGGPAWKNADGSSPGELAIKGGNSNYYLAKLGRFELLGIPQIFYEALRCNADKNKIVPGMFKSDEASSNPKYSMWSNFTAIARHYGRSPINIYNPPAIPAIPATDTVGTDDNIVFKDKVKLPMIFSEHEFLCCKKLGEKTTDAGQCCSGYALTPAPVGGGAPVAGAQQECRLPIGTDLMVYFNRYVSTEGTGTGAPGGGLEDTDFIPETGEVAWVEASYDKIKALGEAYCAYNAVRPGGAFGNYYGEPNMLQFSQPTDSSTVSSELANRIFSIVDGPKDGDAGTDSVFMGYSPFIVGYRWNHHLYCGPPAAN